MWRCEILLLLLVGIRLLLDSVLCSGLSVDKYLEGYDAAGSDSNRKESHLPETAPSLPNVIVLLADNLGYYDVSLFHNNRFGRHDHAAERHESHTPNIDRIGVEGMQFHNWNSVAHLCSASRAALLTGLYPVRTGVYPGVFHPDSVYGLPPQSSPGQPPTKTLAGYLRDVGYATSLVGKWHLGQREPYLPTNHGFDSWLGVPYHMSGGSLDNHICNRASSTDSFPQDLDTWWLPLYQDTAIIQQPLRVEQLATRYVNHAVSFIRNATSMEGSRPFFLYVPFSHVHQLCTPQDVIVDDQVCQWNRDGMQNITFEDAVQEMDDMVGQILQVLDDLQITNNTFVLFTSDNGPWVAERSCSGQKGPFKGKWLQQQNAGNPSCTACPHDYLPSPLDPDQPHRCLLAERLDTKSVHAVDGVPCGEDTGLGSLWEANLRMPALIRYPAKIRPGSETMQMVSTLDVLPTILNLVYDSFYRHHDSFGTSRNKVGQGQYQVPRTLDGVDIGPGLLWPESEKSGTSDFAPYNSSSRVLFFWRDGFQQGPQPLGSPYGRYDVAAVKWGRIKAWFSTKSAHYNNDTETYHDPPLLFDTVADPAEEFPLDPTNYETMIADMYRLVQEHKDSIKWTMPLALERNYRFVPCANRSNNCRTSTDSDGAQAVQ
jgi:arylsulfatase A-like enzyme